MKKQFQILSFAITIILFSCGKHNAEVAGTISTATNELSINGSSLNNESDLFLIDIEGQLRINAISADPAARSASYTISRRGVTKTFIQLNESFLVN